MPGSSQEVVSWEYLASIRLCTREKLFLAPSVGFGHCRSCFDAIFYSSLKWIGQFEYQLLPMDHDITIFNFIQLIIMTWMFVMLLCIYVISKMYSVYSCLQEWWHSSPFFWFKKQFAQSAKQLYSGSTSLLGQYQVIITCIKDFYANKSVYSTIILNVCEPISRLWHFFHCETAAAVRDDLWSGRRLTPETKLISRCCPKDDTCCLIYKRTYVTTLSPDKQHVK